MMGTDFHAAHIRQLTYRCERLERENADLQRQLKRLNRKIVHRCTGRCCLECEGLDDPEGYAKGGVIDG